MPTIYEHRRANLQKLVAEHNGPNSRGGSVVIAKRSGIASATLSQILNHAEVNPSVTEKRRPWQRHQMGDEAARKIKTAFGMDEGAMDRPASLVKSTGLSAAQHSMLVTLEAMLRSGCMTDAECGKELARLRRAYPVAADGFSVPVLMTGYYALMVVVRH